MVETNNDSSMTLPTTPSKSVMHLSSIRRMIHTLAPIPDASFWNHSLSGDFWY